MKTTSTRMLKGLVGVLLLAGLATSALAAGGSYFIDFAAARPKSYAKQYPILRPCPPLVNGTAANPIVGARFLDSVESLMPQDMALGQIVVFEVRIDVTDSVAPENGKATFKMGWSTETTMGAPFGYDEAYGVYCAFIDTADEAHNDAGGNAAVDSTTWVWTNEKNPAKPADEIIGTFDLSGLDQGDTVVLEIWMVLDKTFPDKATGNVQSRLIAANTATGDTINTGNQTVPLLKVDDFATLGNIGDYVWLDTDKDGVQDTGEVGLANVTVRLYKSAVPIATMTTDANGFYLFTGLPTGSYAVEFVLPDSTYKFSPQDIGGNDALDSDADVTTGLTAAFALAPGQTILTVDAGMYLKTTLAVVSAFGAEVRDGQVCVHWQTSSEMGTLGYYVERLVPESGAYIRVNATLVPAKIMVRGLRDYEIVDTGASAVGTVTYRLVELESRGGLNVYGPYVVDLGGGAAAGDELAAPPTVENVSSALEIRAMTAGKGHMVLRWSSVEGKTYRLERSADLRTFEPVAAGIPATAPENVTVVVDGASAGFYRVAAE